MVKNKDTARLTSVTSNSAFGSNTTKSAAAPCCITPFFPCRPTCLACTGPIHSTIRPNSTLPPTPNSVQSSERPSPRPDTPPHADMKSPLFSSGTHGEWSDTTYWIVPSNNASTNFRRFDSSRIGGQHLNCVAFGGMSVSRRQR